MLNLTHPRYVMPVHGDYKRMLLHGQLAEAVGVPAEHIFRLENGLPLEIDADGARVGDRQPSGLVFVDGVEIGDVTDVALRDRRMLSADGIFIIVATVSEADGSSVVPPEVLARGVPFLEGNSRVRRRAPRGGGGLARPRRRPARDGDRGAGVDAPRRPRRLHLRPPAPPPDGAAGRRRGLSRASGAPSARRAALRLRGGERGSRAGARAAACRARRRRAPTTSTTPTPETANAVGGEVSAVITPPSRKPTPVIADADDSSSPSPGPGGPAASPPAARSSRSPTARRSPARRARRTRTPATARATPPSRGRPTPIASVESRISAKADQRRTARNTRLPSTTPAPHDGQQHAVARLVRPQRLLGVDDLDRHDQREEDERERLAADQERARRSLAHVARARRGRARGTARARRARRAGARQVASTAAMIGERRGVDRQGRRGAEGRRRARRRAPRRRRSRPRSPR